MRAVHFCYEPHLSRSLHDPHGTRNRANKEIRHSSSLFIQLMSKSAHGYQTSQEVWRTLCCALSSKGSRTLSSGAYEPTIRPSKYGKTVHVALVSAAAKNQIILSSSRHGLCDVGHLERDQRVAENQRCHSKDNEIADHARASALTCSRRFENRRVAHPRRSAETRPAALT